MLATLTPTSFPVSLQSTSDDTVPVRWQCPIAVDSHVYTSKSDVYSFGVLMYEIFSDGGTPYAELAAGEVLAMVAAGQRLGRPSRTVPEGVVQLIRECTQLSVARRPAMTVVRKWLDKVVRAEDLSQAFVAEHGTTAGWGSSSASWTSGAHTAVGGWDRDADDQHEGEESVL